MRKRLTPSDLNSLEESELRECVSVALERASGADCLPHAPIADFVTFKFVLGVKTIIASSSPPAGWQGQRQALLARVVADLTGLPTLPLCDDDTQKAGNKLGSFLAPTNGRRELLRLKCSRAKPEVKAAMRSAAISSSVIWLSPLRSRFPLCALMTISRTSSLNHVNLPATFTHGASGS